MALRSLWRESSVAISAPKFWFHLYVSFAPYVAFRSSLSVLHASHLKRGCPIRLATNPSGMSSNLPAAMTGDSQALIERQTPQPTREETRIETVARADAISAGTSGQDTGMALTL